MVEKEVTEIDEDSTILEYINKYSRNGSKLSDELEENAFRVEFGDYIKESRPKFEWLRNYDVFIVDSVYYKSEKSEKDKQDESENDNDEDQKEDEIDEPVQVSQMSIPELIEKYSRIYNVSSREAKAIAFCESSNRHFDRNGQVLRGIQNQDDVGLFQINEKYHLRRSQELGIDIYTLEGNVRYAMLLLADQGMQPWHWSQNCWSNKLASY